MPAVTKDPCRCWTSGSLARAAGEKNRGPTAQSAAGTSVSVEDAVPLSGLEAGR
jgi:hypothetical protein